MHRELRAVRRAATAALFAFLVLFATAAAAVAPVNKSFFGTAVEGYDVVAYFTEGRPVEGSADFSHRWRGAEWRFASAEHRDLFAANPEKYAPQYGGYCAYAVSQGATAGIDPKAWKIVDGKLYLNLNVSIQKRWLADVPGFIAKADVNWPKLVDDPSVIASGNPCNPCAAKVANPCAANAANPCAARH